MECSWLLWQLSTSYGYVPNRNLLISMRLVYTYYTITHTAHAYWLVVKANCLATANYLTLI